MTSLLLKTMPTIKGISIVYPLSTTARAENRRRIYSGLVSLEGYMSAKHLTKDICLFHRENKIAGF